MDNATIFTTALLVGFSGAIMPGPLLTVTVTQTAVKGFRAGLLIVLGHAILEALLVVALVLGLTSFLMQASVKSFIAVVGGVFLIYLGFDMARSAYLGKVTDGNPAFQTGKNGLNSGAGQADKEAKTKLAGYVQLEQDKRAENAGVLNLPGASMHPVAAGILLSLSNPYWIIWWATLGLGYITLALENGKAGLLSFFSGHILADLSWYALVSAAVVGSRSFLTPRIYRGIIMVCGLFLLGLGGYFIHSGIWGHGSI